MTPKSHEERVAVFAGSFNPFTIGHADIVRRGLELFDRVAVCIGVNMAKEGAEGAAQQRAQHIRRIYADDPRVSVECWGGLTANFAKKIGARFLLRGVRSVKDYEYERDMADANRAVFGIETAILFATPPLAFVTSSLVRELAAYGHDVSSYLPKTSERE